MSVTLSVIGGSIDDIDIYKIMVHPILLNGDSEACNECMNMMLHPNLASHHVASTYQLWLMEEEERSSGQLV
ncbi:hypothetical protein AQUCO_01700452v1 [Aquilegia coerulea]|uniref:Uncharacterized protein n=1 Tax=Aquilegia coerulea TaxID=218851 RepID=A0A2G5DMZ3_AQUCA|nr:hypothetical protein AQUCO_01700452v1 [Aquilegia coerulea]